MKAALLVLASGCLGRPLPHGAPPDSAADAAPDADPSCPWSSPVPIMVDGLQTTDAVTSPWISNDHATLFYTLVPNGNPAAAQIKQAAQVTSDIYGPPTASLLAANPAVDANTLYFDEASNTNRIIVEAQIGNVQSQMQHNELGTAAHQPAALPGGLVLYFYDANAQLIRRATRSMPQNSFVNSVLLARNDGSMDLIESPTTVDDNTVYVTSHASDGDMILAMTRAAGDPGPFIASATVGTFQQPGASYFDPSLSPDGKTLAFASNVAGGPARLYYVHRACVP